MKRLCTICARGGSKGLPGKNIRDLCGKPLIAWSIEQAKESGVFDLVAVSSDSAEILDIATRYGADLAITRPDELATDEAAKRPVIAHALEASQEHLGERFETLVDLQATSPLRTPEDIVAAVELLERDGRSNVITGAPAIHSPYFNLVEVDANGRVTLSKTPEIELVRRQDAPETFNMNGSIYVWSTAAFLDDPQLFYEDTGLYVMPLERSWDIDAPLDFEIVEFLMERNCRRGAL